MRVTLLGALIILLGGLSALAFGGSPRRKALYACTAVVLGGLLAAAAALAVLWSGDPLRLHAPWAMPYASFSFEIDALSAFFMLPVCILGILCALYGAEYLQAEGEERSNGGAWFFYNLLLAGMLLVLTARNGVLFLISWEIMSLAPFFLVARDHQRAEARSAGLIYLIAAHLGTACLTACFILLGGGGETLDFARFPQVAASSGTAALIFILGLLGFGLKAGIAPFHVWLPEAHPAAPSHVSALMSGVMIKMGMYGILRLLTFFDLAALPLWWGMLLMLLGAASGVLGVLYALGQRDLKRLLAYSSVENIGIITMGCGLALVGLHYRLPLLAVLGLAGALLHVLNHALFKGLLFLGAGAVAHACGTREIDRLGGLLRRMPRTGVCFLLGAAGVSGLPPLNGFISEFLIYCGAFGALGAPERPVIFAAITAIVALALIGGLAAACFTKAFGIVFLGEPRQQQAAAPQDPGRPMLIAMYGLALPCAAIGLAAPLCLSLLQRPIDSVFAGAGLSSAEVLAVARPSLIWIAALGLLLLAAAAGLWAWRRSLLRRRPAARTVTWDCGYAWPSPRMQYSASSFAAPLIDFFELVLRPRRALRAVSGYFPQETALHSTIVDGFQNRLWRPLFQRAALACQRLRWLQPARVHLFAVYIVVVLVLLIGWFLLVGAGVG